MFLVSSVCHWSIIKIDCWMVYFPWFSQESNFWCLFSWIICDPFIFGNNKKNWLEYHPMSKQWCHQEEASVYQGDGELSLLNLCLTQLSISDSTSVYWILGHLCLRKTSAKCLLWTHSKIFLLVHSLVYQFPIMLSSATGGLRLSRDPFTIHLHPYLSSPFKSCPLFNSFYFYSASQSS